MSTTASRKSARAVSLALGLALCSVLACGGSGDGGTPGTGGSGNTSGSGGAAGTTGGGGAAGSPGSAGTGGSAAGVAGTSGTAGVTGTAGSSATAGTGGGNATAGTGGATGSAGNGGNGGNAGNAGTTGSAGTGGATGNAGRGGSIAGNGGGGMSGRGGTGGVTGTGGSTAGTTGSAGTGGGSGQTHWVGTWTGAPQLTETANNPPAALTGAVLRQVVRVTLGGSQIRVRFSNEFGNGNVVINSAHVAVCRANPMDSTIDTATDKALAFSGMASVTIAQGQAVWSDPVDFTLAALSNLTVTVAFGSVPSNVTGHPGSRTTSYEQTGSTTVNAANMASAMKADHWYILSVVDVMADAAAKGLVILGDSITDGRGSTTNSNDRWPDDLAKRLQNNAATAKVSVMNQGIGGNAVASGGLGPTASARYMRDVLNQSGVKYIIVFEGVNDLGAAASASSITSVFDSFITMAHSKGLLIYGATVTPFGSNSYYTASNETNRQSVNTYIRGTKFDGFIDFDAAVKDTSNPPKLLATYDSGDGLHLNPAGYQKMADTTDLALFTR